MTEKLIHPSAIVSSKAKIGANVRVGAFSVVGDNVVIADDVTLHSHVVVEGKTTIGKGTTVFPFTSIGHIPQDLKFSGEESSVEIGEYTMIREHVTIHPGTAGDKMVTKVGNRCLLMVGVHVAHDCSVGNHVIMANNATLAGHVEVGDFAVIGGLSAVHQFVRIGKHAMIGGMSGIENDVIPYGQATGERANLSGLNLVGLKRREFSRDDIHALRTAYRLLFASEGTLQERVEDVEELFKGQECVKEMIAFVRDNGSRAICQPRNGKNASAS